jgi:Cu(I)/Ag(I) efflux system protein CusF
LAFSLAVAVALFTAFILFPAASYAQHDHHNAAKSCDAPSDAEDVSHIYVAHGSVTEIRPDNNSLVLNHGPIEALGWGSMIMPFRVEDPSLLEGLKVGDKVRFDLTVNSTGSDYFISDVEAE